MPLSYLRVPTAFPSSPRLFPLPAQSMCIVSIEIVNIMCSLFYSMLSHALIYDKASHFKQAKCFSYRSIHAC